ncbi:MAG: YybH family protein [Geminicoccaceae bacterium]
MLKSTALAMVGMLGLTLPAAADDVREAIEQVNAQFVEAFKAGDAATIASLYTDTAKLLPPDATEVAGHDAIQNLWQSWIDDGLKDLTLEAMEVESSGDLAYEIGQFSLQAPAENNAMATATGNYVVVWKREDGNWRLHVDTWNDAPAK